MFDPETLDPGAVTAAQAHAVKAYPDECCGFITAEGYKPIRNISKNPQNEFRITSRMVAKHSGALAFIHSHPDGPACPSGADMKFQQEMRMPFGITVSHEQGAEAPFFFGDQVKIPDLVKRPFRHGVTDCYSAIRDWYRIKLDITLRDFPRDWDWWRGTQNFYQDKFKEVGFVEIPASEVRENDVWLAIYGQNVTKINHGGIVASNGGLAYHHLGHRSPYKAMRIARMEPLNLYRDHIRMWLRYVG